MARTMLEDVPLQMRQAHRWVLYNANKVPLRLIDGGNASVTVPEHWSSFEACVACAQRNGDRVRGVGFVLGDGIVGIDFDNCLDENGNITDPEVEYFIAELGSYTEISPSGRGLHVFVLAEYVDIGRRQKGMEIYGKDRYFTVTGNQYNQNPLTHNQAAVNVIAAIIVHGRVTVGAACDWSIPDAGAFNSDVANTIDWELHSKLTEAKGDEYTNLFNGHFDTAKYASNSEACIALCNMMAHRCDSPSQVQRLFLRSAFGQIERNHRKSRYYVGKAFDRKVPMIDISKVEFPEPAKITVVEDEEDDVESELNNSFNVDEQLVYSRPPGLTGEIFDYINAQAVKTMPQAAICGALALMAGICGRQYQANNGGVNLYIMLMSYTASGKDQMANGLSMLIDSIAQPRTSNDFQSQTIGYPSALHFRGPDELSGRGLERTMSQSPQKSLLSVFGEFAYILAQLSVMKGQASHMTQLRSTLLKMFSMSAKGQVYRANANANAKDDLPPINSPAFTLLCESTPALMYKYMDEEMIHSGLLPRFICIENKTRTVRNNNRVTEPPMSLRSSLVDLMSTVLRHFTEFDLRIDVALDDVAARLVALEQWCEAKQFETMKAHGAPGDLWSRTYHLVIKIAALLAIGEDFASPRVNDNHLSWAQNFVIYQTQQLIAKFVSGHVGKGLQEDVDVSRDQEDAIKHLRKIIKSYIEKKNDKYDKFRLHNLVPHGYLHNYCNTKCFTRHRNGRDYAVNDAIKILIKTGEIRQNDNVNVGKLGRRGTFYEILGDL